MTKGFAGRGLTVIVKDCAMPEQPLVGVTVIVAVMGEAVELVVVKLGIEPIPLALNPIAVLLFDHENIVPVTEPVKVKTPDCSPPQSVLFAGTDTSGAGLTVMFFVTVVVPHSFVTSKEMTNDPDVL